MHHVARPQSGADLINKGEAAGWVGVRVAGRPVNDPVLRPIVRKLLTLRTTMPTRIKAHWSERVPSALCPP